MEIVSSNQYNLTHSFSLETNNIERINEDAINIVEWFDPSGYQDIEINPLYESEYQKPFFDEPKNLIYLFKNFKSMSAIDIDLILDEFVKNKINFDEIINLFSSSPSGELLELGKSALRRFSEFEYENILHYVNDEELDEYIKCYFIEAIIEWDTISNSRRLNDIRNLFKNIKNDNVFKRTLMQAISELS